MNKILNKKGSVLFLVVVVMALLLVAASATYYVVRNQHMSANTHYSSEQSYQTAYSVSKAVEQYLTIEQANISKDNSAYSDSLFKQMMELKKDETLDASAKLDEYGLGDFEIEIKRIEETGDEGVFEITTKAEVNGETTAVTQVWKVAFTGGTSYPGVTYFTKFLVSTGYRDEDVYLTANHIYGDVYFENPFTSAGNTTYQRSIYCSDTLMDNGVKFEASVSQSMEIVVANNYYSHSAKNQTEMDRIKALIVGGDCEVGKNWQGKKIVADAVYVLGNYTANIGNEDATIFVRGDCYINASDGGVGTVYYINGDLHLGKDADYALALGSKKFFVKGDVYFHKDGLGYPMPTETIKYWGSVHNETYYTPDYTLEQYTEKVIGEFPIEEKIAEASEGKHNFTDWLSIQQYISETTGKNYYGTWNAEGYFNKKFSGNPVIKLSDTSNPAVTYDSNVGGGKYVVKIDQSCTIQPAEGWGWGYYYIVIDATKEDIYIKLDPGSSNTFTFGTANTYNNACGNVSVLVEGEHAVVFVLPSAADFQMTNNSFIGHAGIALAATGYATVDDLIAKNVLVAGSLANQTQVNMIGTAHNNIFLVSSGTNNHLSFDAGDCTLCGYIYAPASTLQVETSSRGVSFYGGLIVGSYYFVAPTTMLIYEPPYDPYGRGSDIMSDLMATCNGTSTGTATNAPTTGGTQASVAKPKFLGYK